MSYLFHLLVDCFFTFVIQFVELPTLFCNLFSFFYACDLEINFKTTPTVAVPCLP